MTSSSRRVDNFLIKCLKQLRLEANLSQSELASRLNSAQSFVSKYEGGERALAFREVWAIAIALDSSPEFIIKSIRQETEGQK